MSPVRNFGSKDSNNGISNGMRLKVFIILLFAFVVINQVVTPGLTEESQKREVSAEGETTDVMIKRLEAMEAALAQVAGSQLPLEVPETELIQKTEEEFDEAKMEITLPKSDIPSATEVLPAAESPKGKKSATGMAFWLVGLSLTSGLGFLLWRKISLNTDKRIKELKSELQEKNKLLEQSEITRKAIEKATLQNERENQQPQERRQSSRLDLSRDYNRTIILRIDGSATLTINPERSRRIESPDKSNPSTSSFDELRTWPERSRRPSLGISPEQSRRAKSIKSFANNISVGGLCFETRKDFEESQIINLRLFFFGDKVPMIKIKAEIIWKKTVLPVNYYGVSFASLKEENKIELNRYIESKIVK